MFPPEPTSKLAQHALAALRVARSFLLLEDDPEVDWEVDKDELTPPPHMHRGPLRGRRIARRPGAPAPTCHVCLCPVERGGTLPGHARARREQATGGSARARDLREAGARARAWGDRAG